MGRARLKMAASSRCLWMAGALVLAATVAAAADAQQGCPDLTYSKFLGTKKTGAKYVDHTQLSSKGSIVQVSLYYNKAAGCLRGAKTAYGQKPTPGMIGSSANTTEAALRLKDGEFVTKAEYKATKCIEYVKLSTNKGRSISVGSASAPAALITTAANKTGGRLIAIRGFQAVADSKPGALQQLQFVWGSGNCQPAAAAAADLEYGSGSVVNSDPTVCAAKTDMCDEEASMNQFSYCVWNPPYTKSACKGGCCLSSGKCASSSCAISGVGKDVANMICYGTNSGVGFGGSELCTGLACKLATTGCTTDAFGGNCVGTVAHYAEHVAVHPDSKKYIGATCLDATPSDYTLDANGQEAGNEGIYISKLWTICDCSTDGSDPYAGVPNVMNLTGMSNLTKNDVLLAISQVLPKVNLTSVVDSVTKGSDDDNRITELFPSITGIFKKPTAMPTITLPSFFGGDHHAEGLTGTSAGNSSESPAIQFKLPDLSTLLSSLAARANSTEDPAAAASAEPSLTPPITPATIAAIPAKATASAAQTAATALTGLRGFLGKIMPALTKSNMRTAGPSSGIPAASAPVAVAADQPAAAADASKHEGNSTPAAAATPQPAPKDSAAPAAPTQATAPAAAATHTPETSATPAPAEVPAPQQHAAASSPQPVTEQQQTAVPATEPIKQPSPSAAAPAPAQDQHSAAAAQPHAAAAPVPEEPQQQQQTETKKTFGGFSGLQSALANYRPVQYYEYEPYELPAAAAADHPATDAAHPAADAAHPAASQAVSPAIDAAHPAAGTDAGPAQPAAQPAAATAGTPASATSSPAGQAPNPAGQQKAS